MVAQGFLLGKSIARPGDLSKRCPAQGYTNLSEEFEIVSYFGWTCFHIVLVVFVQSSALELDINHTNAKQSYHVEDVVDVEFSEMIWQNSTSQIAVTMKIKRLSSQQLVDYHTLVRRSVTSYRKDRSESPRDHELCRLPCRSRSPSRYHR